MTGARQAWPIFLLLLGNICLALGPVLVRLETAEKGVGPVAAGFWRFALALPFLLILAWHFERHAWSALKGQSRLLILAGILFAADLASWHLGIELTKLSNASLLGNAASILFPVWGWWMLRERPSTVQALGLAMALIGTILLVGRSAELSPRNLVGDLLCLLAGILYTVYLVTMTKARGTLPSWSTLLVTTLAGAPFMLFFAIALGETIWPQNWVLLVALAIVTQVAGQALLIAALGKISTLAIGVALLSQPVVSAVIGWTMFDEKLFAMDVAGAAAICMAIFLVASENSRTTNKKPAYKV